MKHINPEIIVKCPYFNGTLNKNIWTLVIYWCNYSLVISNNLSNKQHNLLNLSICNQTVIVFIRDQLTTSTELEIPISRFPE